MSDKATPLLVHVTDGGAVYVTDNHDFSEATLIFRIDNDRLRNPEAFAASVVNAVNSHNALVAAARCALADLEGIMPEFEPSGDCEHPGWQTIHDLKNALRLAESD